MYQHYEDHHDETPWWRRGWTVLAAVAVVAALVAAVAVLAWPSEDAPGSPGGDDPSTAASSSTCGLPDGDQAVPTAGPADVDWVLVNGLATPRSTEHGPGTEDDGIHSCFARSPMGAVLAAMNLYADGFDPSVDRVRLIKERALRGAGYDEAIAFYEEHGEEATEPDFDQQVAGFRVTSYDRDEAVVETVLLGGSGELAGQLLASTDVWEWESGDWKLLIAADGEPQTAALSSLAGYVAWSSATADETGSPGLERSTPAWAERAKRLTPLPAAASCGLLDKFCDVLTPGAALGAVQGAVTDAATEVTSAVTSGVLDDLATQASEAADWALKTLLTTWMELPDPDVTSPDSVAVWLTTEMQWLIAAAMIASILLASYRLAITGKFEHGRELVDALVRVTIVSGIIGVATTVAMEAGDLFSEWIFTQVDLDLNLVEIMAGVNLAWVVLSFGLFVLIVQLIQLALMFVRTAMVPLLVFGITLSAAGSNTGVGRQAFQKQLSWLIAFVLFKPVAALIYAVAIKMISSTDDIATVLGGMMLMILGVLALPGLMRLIVPATAAMGGASAGGIAGATVGAAMATGAVVATGGASAAGGFAGAGPPGGAGFAGTATTTGSAGASPIPGAAPAAAGGGASPASAGAGAAPGDAGGGARQAGGAGAGEGSGAGAGAPGGFDGARQVGSESPGSSPGGVGSSGASGVEVSRVLDAASRGAGVGGGATSGAAGSVDGDDEQ